MNKAELIDMVAETLDGGRKHAAEAVETVIASITQTVAEGEKVVITGFGVFEKVDRQARTGRNPLTGAIVKIKATQIPKFRPGAEFKLSVLAGRSNAQARVTAARESARSTVESAGAALKKAAPAKKAPAKKAPAKKAPAKKAPAKAAPAKAAPAKKAPAKAAPAKKAPAKKAPAKKAPAKKAPATQA